MSHVNQSNVAVRQCSLRRREYSRLPQHSTLPILNMIGNESMHLYLK